MLNRNPTYLGVVGAVSGAKVSVHLAPSVGSGLSIINGQVYKIAQVASFIRIPQGYQDLFGVVSEVGADAIPENVDSSHENTGRWMTVHLVGEAISGFFERGISQHPNIGDAVHIAIEEDLRRIYNMFGAGHVEIGALSSAENISAKVSLNQLVTRHSAILGSTGSGKSTTVASLLRSITGRSVGAPVFPSARILMLDIHGEYADAMKDSAKVYSVDPQSGQKRLQIPFWALDAAELLQFLVGPLNEKHEMAFLEKMYALKAASHEAQNFLGVKASSITVDTPIPFSLYQMWGELIDFEVMTLEGANRDTPTEKTDDGDISALKPPQYQPHAMGPVGPFINKDAHGIRRHLDLLRARLLDSRYNFLLHPGPWEPNLSGASKDDLDALLEGWLGGDKPVTILDLSGVPSRVLEQLVGSILKIIYEALFWSRDKSEGGQERPLLVVMEEAHRYLSGDADNLALKTVQRIAKEGRKYGVGAMIVSQRPSEVDETILSQCGTFFALRLSNPQDRSRVKGILPDNLAGLLEVLPVLRTGEAIIMGEAAQLPMRCRITLPPAKNQPQSQDPKVFDSWSIDKRAESYARVAASWRAQSPFKAGHGPGIQRAAVSDATTEEDYKE